MKAPFPAFGGKSHVASIVWERFGDTTNYVEPFFNSGAVLLSRPDSHKWWERIETANDLDGLISNFWRAVQFDSDAVAHYADWPVNENDLHARHSWLVGQRSGLQAALEGDPDYYDAKVAGWWLWGICAWIGSGWCSGKGPWVSVDGQLVRDSEHEGDGLKRQLPHLGDAGQCINRKRPHLGNAGQGINRKFTGSSPDVCAEWSEHLQTMMRELQNRLRRVRVCCGDWSRVCGDTPTQKLGITGVFLDPPYSTEAVRDNNLYTVEDLSVAHNVREWAIAHGDNPLYRIALCGYEGEHTMPNTWTEYAWKTAGGYASQSSRGNINATRERIWFSPHCLPPVQQRLL